MKHLCFRKLALLLTLAVLLTLILTLGISAAEPSTVPRIVDEANLLDDNEEAMLRSHIQGIRENYGVDAVIVTVDSLGAKSPKRYADDFYDSNQYGLGENRDGILMLLAMESRDYYFLLNGSLAGRSISGLENRVVPALSDGSYYDAFQRYLNYIPTLVDAPVSSDVKIYMPTTTQDRLQTLAIFAVIGIAVGFLTTYFMKRSMKTARAQAYAMDYIRRDSFKLTRQQDIYLYRTRSRVRVQSSSSGGSGGSRSGGGRSGGGGKF